MIYLVAATGGLENPYFKSCGTNRGMAQTLFAEWSADMVSDDGSRVDLIGIEGEMTTLIDTAEYAVSEH